VAKNILIERTGIDINFYHGVGNWCDCQRNQIMIRNNVTLKIIN